MKAVINGKTYEVSADKRGRVVMRAIAYGMALATEECTPHQARQLAHLLQLAADVAEGGAL